MDGRGRGRAGGGRSTDGRKSRRRADIGAEIQGTVFYFSFIYSGEDK